MEAINENSISYTLIVDTSILYSKDLRHIACSEFEEFWEKYSKELNLNLIIPEVVKGERLYRIQRACNSHVNNINSNHNKVQEILKKKIKVNKIKERFIRTALEDMFDEWLSSKNGIIEITPASQIDLKKLINCAIWRVPPFENDDSNENKEKGLKDFLILETVNNLFRQASETKEIIFIVSDKFFYKTAREKLKNFKYTNVFDSIDGVISYFELKKQQFDKKTADALIEKAKNKFYDFKKEMGLYNDANIGQFLRNKSIEWTQKIEDNNPNFINYKGRVFITNTEFIGRENKMFQWKTSLEHVFIYIENDYYPDVTTDNISDFNNKKVLKIYYEAIWESKVDVKGRFVKVNLLNTKYINHEFYTPHSHNDRFLLMEV